MKQITHLLTVALFLCLSIAVSAQVEQEFTIQQGEPLEFHVLSDILPPTIQGDGPQNGVVEFISVDANDYMYHYIPNEDFIGFDGFELDVVTSITPPFTSISYTFAINVVASDLVSNDDFVLLTDLNPVVIDPAANDVGAPTSIVLAHVMHGEATVNDDNTITYTPTEEEVDYIVYSAKDEAGTVSNSTIYISHDADGDSLATSRNYKIASGNQQYIILNNDSYTTADSVLSFGTITQINDYVYEFVANENAEGSDEITFVSDDWGDVVVSIDVYEVLTDEGWVKDDEFYGASNTNIQFDVKENDNTDNYVISDYSSDLVHLGNGVFSYTPPAQFKGTKTFFYTGDDGAEEETGTIKVYFNNFTPTNDFNYTFDTPKNQPRVLEYDVPLGTEYFNIYSYPMNGTVEVFGEDESIDVGCVESLEKVFVLYTPDDGYTGDDNIIVKYCASDNNTCEEVTIDFNVVDTEVDECICVDDCVWPGDANGDGKVSVLDALSIGRYIGNGGDARDSSAYGETFEGTTASDWAMTQLNGRNLKHADADGNGYITKEDFDTVIDNYGSINNIVRNDALGIKSVPFYISAKTIVAVPGELIEFDIHLGSSAYPAIDMNGVAFAINFSSTFVDSSTAVLDFDGDSYFVKDAPYVSLMHQPTDGIFHSAIVKSNSTSSTGYGVIGTLSFIVEEVAEGFKDTRRAIALSDIIETITISDIVIEDNNGKQYNLPNSTFKMEVENTTTISSTDVKVYPNPTSDKLFIDAGFNAISKINIYDLAGNRILTRNQKNIDVSNLEEGMYFIETRLENGESITSKFIKTN